MGDSKVPEESEMSLPVSSASALPSSRDTVMVRSVPSKAVETPDVLATSTAAALNDTPELRRRHCRLGGRVQDLGRIRAARIVQGCRRRVRLGGHRRDRMQESRRLRHRVSSP